jgi:hypothetical protein
LTTAGLAMGCAEADRNAASPIGTPTARQIAVTHTIRAGRPTILQTWSSVRAVAASPMATSVEYTNQRVIIAPP